MFLLDFLVYILHFKSILKVFLFFHRWFLHLRRYEQLAFVDAKTHLTSKSYVVAVIAYNLCSKRWLFIAVYRVTDNISCDRAKSYCRRDKWYTLFGTALCERKSVPTLKSIRYNIKFVEEMLSLFKYHKIITICSKKYIPYMNEILTIFSMLTGVR